MSFNPEPGPRGVISDIVINAMSDDGRPLNQNNTLFGIEVTGSGSVHSRFPPRLKTAVTEPAPGEVIVHWGRDNVTTAPFRTTEELHTPDPRPPAGNNSRKFPKLLLCGRPHGISEAEQARRGLFLPGETVPEDPDDVSLIVSPFYVPAGIRWLNLSSPESRAKLRTPTGGIATPGTEIFNKYLDSQTVEVAIQTVMDEFVREGNFPLPIHSNDS